MKEVRGCDKDIAPVVLNGVEFRRCPAKGITEAVEFFLETYSAYKKGFLPNPGGWLAQPIKWSQMAMIADIEFEKYREKETKK